MGRALVQRVLRNRIILCTGTAPKRKDLLLDTYHNDSRFIPFKKIFLSTTDPDNANILFDQERPVCELFPEYGQDPRTIRQLNCLNCITSSIRNAVNDPEVLDEDVILFKHETFFIKDMALVTRAIGMIVLYDYDLVIQSFHDWYHTGVFFLKVSSARPIFKGSAHVKELPLQNCELYLKHNLFNKLSRIYTVNCHPYEGEDNRLGFYHIPRTPLHAWEVWGMEDYHTLFKDVPL